MIDATVRHEALERYASAGAADPVAAAQAADRDKQRRYPPTGGRHATTFMVGGWDRLGPQAEALLVRCAGIAATEDRRRGRVAAGRLSKWRARLDDILQRGVAARILAARTGLAGKRPGRRAAESALG